MQGYVHSPGFTDARGFNLGGFRGIARAEFSYNLAQSPYSSMTDFMASEVGRQTRAALASVQVNADADAPTSPCFGQREDFGALKRVSCATARRTEDLIDQGHATPADKGAVRVDNHMLCTPITEANGFTERRTGASTLCVLDDGTPRAAGVAPPSFVVWTKGSMQGDWTPLG